MECMWKLQMTVILIGLLILYQNQDPRETHVLYDQVSQNYQKEIFTTLFHPLSLLLVCSSHSGMSQPDRVPAVFYNLQPCMDNCQLDLFLCLMDVGLVYCFKPVCMHNSQPQKSCWNQVWNIDATVKSGCLLTVMLLWQPETLLDNNIIVELSCSLLRC